MYHASVVELWGFALTHVPLRARHALRTGRGPAQGNGRSGGGRPAGRSRADAARASPGAGRRWRWRASSSWSRSRRSSCATTKRSRRSSAPNFASSSRTTRSSISSRTSTTISPKRTSPTPIPTSTRTRSINDEIERLRHSATQSLLTRPDTLIVASVSCIYGLGSPSDYMELSADVKIGDEIDRDEFLRKLVDMQYRRNDLNLVRGTFRVRGDTLEFVGVDEELVHRIEFFGDEIEAINVVNMLTGEYVESQGRAPDLPRQALHHARGEAAARDRRDRGRARRAPEVLQDAGEAARSAAARACARATISTCCARSATATASRTTRATSPAARPGSTPWCLLDFFPKDWLLFVDESHVTIPQVGGMYDGDRSRKESLVEHGFRLPIGARQPAADVTRSSSKHINQVVYVSATPATYELSANRRRSSR